MERTESVSALTKELLGPRNGLNEILINDNDPRNEFITGILIPKMSKSTRDVDSEAELILTDDDFGDEQSTDEGNNIVVTGNSPALDPKSMPKSLGISFIVSVKDDNNKIGILYTWARYVSDGENWIRKPDFKEIEFSLPLKKNLKDDRDNSGVEFSVRTTHLGDRNYKVSIFMINNTTLHDPSQFNTEDCIFQPQIRVKCDTNIIVTPFESEKIEDPDINDPVLKEKMSLKLLYRNRPSLARGHLVGVTWREIDPQNTYEKKPLPKEPPFYWVDGEMLSDTIRNKYSACDVRTEYLPMYSVVAPDMSWRPEFGVSPEFHPLKLSEGFSPEEITRYLYPLRNGYRKWIKWQLDQLQSIDGEYQKIGKLHIEGLEESCKRIENGIELLIKDEDARLAFCFMNKVIATQQAWARKDKEVKVFPWRPFQLAFILQNIASIFDDEDPYRNKVDLLFFATGGGKTESYLGLAVFTMALLRLRAKKDKNGHRKGTGVNVLSRYTLRLLTIQQYRRALRVITASEYLRVHGLKEGSSVGWRPNTCTRVEDYIWGSQRFSIGLFVGGGVTPNSLQSLKFVDEQGRFQNIPGAIELLRKGGNKSYGEPAQILNCPCCSSQLAVPSEGLGPGKHTLHFLFKGNKIKIPTLDQIVLPGAESINNLEIVTHENRVYHTFTVSFLIKDDERVKVESISQLWQEHLKNILGENIILLSSSPIRMGYFIRTYLNSQNNFTDCGFEIICPNPECELNHLHWSEKVPVNISNQMVSGADMEYQEILEGFKVLGNPSRAFRMPIPAYTVDDQIYHSCPSMIIATVDKFAQLASEPRAASIFGNVEYYHARWGYYREYCPPSDGATLPKQLKSHPAGYKKNSLHKKVDAFDPPSLIIQDEMHLVEGPLGSMFGLYEIAIDELSTKYKEGKVIKPKFIVSTATVSQAQTQIQALFGREFVQFPSPGINIEDNFFSHSPLKIHPMDSDGPGRLYIGVCAPGKGAQTPLVRIWANQLQNAKNLIDSGYSNEQVDGFWTIVGYFNAVRELAGAATLYRQDIPERMEYISGSSVRDLSTDHMELSSRKDSMELPSLLDQLEITLKEGNPVNAVLATSMFGTGVDVDRLRSMVINGQPKSTSSYIQASGRVGRSKGGLVITFFRASRPRDLDHYEHFTGYHHALYKHVEPITVAPFSPRARERAIGPVCTAILRNAKTIGGEIVNNRWRIQQRLEKKQFISGANLMATERTSAEVNSLIQLIINRLEKQPLGRKPEVTQVLTEIRSELDRWKELAQKHDDLLYKESSMASTPTHPVVLGDLQHYFNNLEMAFENAPSSLRDVEGTTTFKG